VNQHAPCQPVRDIPDRPGAGYGPMPLKVDGFAFSSVQHLSRTVGNQISYVRTRHMGPETDTG